MLATVSHLPHVLANVLVAQAARARAEEGEPLPATGPSFRDITRVAGANTAIWRDIYLANADALIEAIDDATGRLADGPRRARGRRRGRDRGLERRGGRRPPAAAGGRARGRRGHGAARLRPQPARRRRRGRPRTREGVDQHRGHGPVPGARPIVRLHRPVDRRRGARGAGRGARRRARAAGGARMNQAFRPGAALRGTLTPPPDKSLSHRAALLGAMSSAPVHVTNYLESADTRSSLDAVQALGARVAAHDDGTLTIHGPGLRGAAPGAAIDVGNAGTLLRLLPGWLAGQPEGGTWTLDGDESIRRRPVDRVAGPARRDGRRARGPRRPLHAAHRDRPAAARDRVRAARRLGADQELRAARGAAGGGDDHGGRARAQPRPHRAAARPRGRRHPPRRRPRERDGPGRARPRRDPRARRSVVGRVPRRGRGARPRIAPRRLRDGGQLDPRRVLPHPGAHGGGGRRRARGPRERRAGRRAAAATSRSRTARSSPRG